jgi:hypothetical protein
MTIVRWESSRDMAALQEGLSRMLEWGRGAADRRRAPARVASPSGRDHTRERREVAASLTEPPRLLRCRPEPQRRSPHPYPGHRRIGRARLSLDTVRHFRAGIH